MSGSILIAEDEEQIASFLEKGLRAAGYATTIADDGPSALVKALSGEFDLLILDIGLPLKNGFEVLREIRERDHDLPVVILTARDSARDAVAGLEGGADDYVRKPFPFDELLARVRARLREERAPEPTSIQVGDMTLDLLGRSVTVGGETVEMTAREFAMTEFFFSSPGQVLSREQILSRVWGYDFDPRSNVVDVYVGRLRKKLGEGRITGIRGMGYRLEAG
ncbi:MAG TPA: response regulator transcription factor [Actinomycetota bacterium]|nr:response regulator transcription factor [Actinomycetota bacterium]